jgi:putative ABC transport system ATP-binding protein
LEALEEKQMTDAMVSLQDIVKRFKVGDGHFTALRGITTQFARGEFTGLVGPSGSGKTTLLNIIGSLDAPSEGTAHVLGKNVAELTHTQSAALRNDKIGFIFQSYNLLSVYTVYENVEFPLLLLKMPAAERRQAVMQALDWVGLTDKVKSRPNQLSGGESQRVAIARAIVKRPAMVLADEPTANLDAENSHRILRTLVTLNQDLGATFIFSTHDQKVIQYLHRVLRLEDGRLIGDERTDGAVLPRGKA